MSPRTKIIVSKPASKILRRLKIIRVLIEVFEVLLKLENKFFHLFFTDLSKFEIDRQV